MNNTKRWVVRMMLEFTQSMMAERKRDWSSGLEKSPDVEEILDIPYVNRGGVPLAMDIYKPIGEQYNGKELPVIVTIHGGGLVFGDRKMDRPYARYMAMKGYLVFAISYRFAPRATIDEQLDDICAGMDVVGRKIVDFDVDFSRVFLTADSAGAFLALYTTAMKQSEKLQDAIGNKPSRLVFKAIGLSCGMFYTNRDDALGNILAEQFYGGKEDDQAFLRLMNPEHPEIVNHLPPVFLITSRGDFLNNYTIMFANALKKAGNPMCMLYYGERELLHTFNQKHPDYEQSIDANEKMLAFFEEMADIRREEQKQLPASVAHMKSVQKEIEEGNFQSKKLWEAVYAMNGKGLLSRATALEDDHRKYSYHLMFRRWRQYANVFHAKGMDREHKAVVGILGAHTAESIFAFYGLNMTGADVSVIPHELSKDFNLLKQLIEEEKITDLCITDYVIPVGVAKKLVDQKDELGLKNIIILSIKVCGPTTTKKIRSRINEKKRALHQTEGLLFMKTLLVEHEADATDFIDDMSSGDDDRPTIILHRPKAEKGQYEAVAYSEREINEYTIGLLGNVEKKDVEKQERIGLTLDFFHTRSLAKQVHRTFLKNDTLICTYKSTYSKRFSKAIETYDMDRIYVDCQLMDIWKNHFHLDAVRFVGLKTLCLEQGNESLDELKKKAEEYQSYINDAGGHTAVEVSPEQSKDFAASFRYGSQLTEERQTSNNSQTCAGYFTPIPMGMPLLPPPLPPINPQFAMKLMQISPDIMRMVSEMGRQINSEGQSDRKKMLQYGNEILGSFFEHHDEDYYYEIIKN